MRDAPVETTPALDSQTGWAGVFARACYVIPGEHVPVPLKAVLATEILVKYARVRWRLARTSLPALVRGIRSTPRMRSASAEPGSLEARLIGARLGNAVNRTLRVLPTDSRCLVQSLVLSHLLAARGISSTLIIGAHSSPEFKAHAWVEHCGMALLPREGFQDSRLLEI